MKKILFALLTLVSVASMAQAPYPRSGPVLTPVDARERVSLTFGIPITNDTTLNGGLDSLGSVLYAKNYSAVFYRDTTPGGHRWTRFSSNLAGIVSLNGLSAASQTFTVGTNGTNFNIVSAGSVHTFNIPIASLVNTGLLSAANFTLFTNKLNLSDTGTMLAPYVRSIVLNTPTNSFGSPVVFSLSNHTATGNLSFNNQSNNTFLAGPASGGVGPVSWRLLANADLPISPVTPGNYTNANITVDAHGIITAVANGAGGGPGGGGIGSIGITVPAAFSVSPSALKANGVFNISAIGNATQYINGSGNLVTFPNIPSQLNLVAGSGINIGGTYPNLTITSIAGGGSVTQVSAGNLSPLFTTTVLNGTTTPAISFNLANAAAFTIFGNNTTGSAAPTFFAPVLASQLFANQGTSTTVLHGNTAGNPTWASVNLATDITGNLPISRLNSGTGASATTYWRGDGQWAPISGSGGGSVTSVAIQSTDLAVAGSPITGTGTFTLNINPNAVTFAKIQQLPAGTLIGNPTAGTANSQAVVVGYGLTFNSSGALVIDSANLPKDTIPFYNRGLPGHNLAYVANGGVYFPRFRDSLGLHIVLNADSSWTFYSTGGGSGTDNGAYHTITQPNDSTAIFHRPDLTADTIVFHTVAGGGGGSCANCYLSTTQVDANTFTLNRATGVNDTVRIIATSAGFTLTTNNTTGPATFTGGVLNIPNYTSTTTFQQSITNGNTLTKNDTIVQANKSIQFYGGQFVLGGSYNYVPDGSILSSKLSIQIGTMTDIGTAANGTQDPVYVTGITTPVLAASNTNVTYSDAYTFWINSAPFASTNVTITKGYALGVGGNSIFKGAVNMDIVQGAGATVAPTSVAGTGAGTSPTISISGSTLDGSITITTGTSPAGSNAIIATMTFFAGTTFSNTCFPVLQPANAVTAALSAGNSIYTSGSSTGWSIRSGSTALAASTTYVWYYHVMGN